MKALGYKSPRSAAVIINNLLDKGALIRKRDNGLQLIINAKFDEGQAQTVNIPYVGVVSCGNPILAEENIDALFPVSTELARPPYQYFLLRAKGNSMDQRGIKNGDLVLVRQCSTANVGDIVVALIDDEAMVKEFHRSGNMIILRPRSSDNKYQPIILSEDFRIQGVVIKTIQGL
jgi:repressor LexA